MEGETSGGVGCGDGDLDLRALFIAAATGNIMGLQTMNFDMSVDLNQQGTCGRTALSVAAAAGHTLLVRLLRTKGARIYVEGCALDRSALHWAATAGQLLCIQAMVENLPDPELGIAENVALELNRRDSQGSTPLFLASTAHPRACQSFLYLLRNGALQNPDEDEHLSSVILRHPQSIIMPGARSSHTIKSPCSGRAHRNAHKNGYHSAAENHRYETLPPPPCDTSGACISGYCSASGTDSSPLAGGASSPLPRREAHFPLTSTPPLNNRPHHQLPSSPTSCCSLSPCSPSPSSVLNFPPSSHPKRVQSDKIAPCLPKLFPPSMKNVPQFLPPPPAPPPTPTGPVHHEPCISTPPTRRYKGLAPGLPPRHAVPITQEPPPSFSSIRTRSKSVQDLGSNHQQALPPAILPHRFSEQANVPASQPNRLSICDLNIGGERSSAWQRFVQQAPANGLPDNRSMDELRGEHCPSPPLFYEPPNERPVRDIAVAQKGSQPQPRHSFAMSCHSRMESGAEILRELHAAESQRDAGEEVEAARDGLQRVDRPGAVVVGVMGIRALKEMGLRELRRESEDCAAEEGVGRNRKVAAVWSGAKSGAKQRVFLEEEGSKGAARLPVVGRRDETSEGDQMRSGSGHLRNVYAHWLRMDFLSMVVESGDCSQLQKEIQKQELNEFNKRGLTLVMVAAKYGHKHCVSFLLREGASLFVEGALLGRSALHWAAERGHTDVLMSILEFFKKPTSSACARELKRKDTEGDTPLILACRVPGNRNAFLFLYRLESALGGCAPAARTRTRRTVSLPQIMSR